VSIPPELLPWTGDDSRTYTLLEAAALCVPFSPTYRFPGLQSLMTDEYRRQLATRDGWLERLKAAAKNGDLETVTGYTVVQKTRQVPRWEYGSARETYSDRVPSLSHNTVELRELRRWLEANGHRPEFFFPSDTDETSAALKRSGSQPAQTEGGQAAQADAAPEDLNGKARRTAFAMIGGLAELLEESIDEPHKEPGLADKILAKIESRYGFTIGRRTIAEWLKGARDLKD
jgi:hypothetical protein